MCKYLDWLLRLSFVGGIIYFIITQKINGLKKSEPYTSDIERRLTKDEIKELVEELKNAFIKKEYKKMLLPLDSLADILWHHDHNDLKSLANEIYSYILELEGYDAWTGEFKESTLNQNQKLRLKQEISQKYKDFLRCLSDYFLI